MQVIDFEALRCPRLYLLAAPHVAAMVRAHAQLGVLRSTNANGFVDAGRKLLAMAAAAGALHLHMREVARVGDLRLHIIGFADQAYRDLFGKDLPP